MNPMQMLKALVQAKKNPQEMVSTIMGTNNNPVMKNLVQMMKKGDKQGVENFARNLFKEQNRDFDSEYKEFLNMMKTK